MLLSEEVTSTAPAVRPQLDDDRVIPEASEDFVITPYVQEITDHAVAYLSAGYPVHFSGPAGTGKTTLAFHVASILGRPVTLIHGDDEFAGSDLVGRDSGYRRSRLVDNYIHSVVRTEDEMQSIWEDNRLTTACEQGDTLIYDEFTRSRPEANNALLSILSEKILNLPRRRQWGKGFVEVNPMFRAIFTSNPEEYAGVHKTQDALRDRLITIDVGHYDRETEICITMKKSGAPRIDGEIIVDIVRELRKIGVNNNRPTIRSSIAIARILAHVGARAVKDDVNFRWICRDVLNTDTVKVSRGGTPIFHEMLDEVVGRICDAHPSKAGARPPARSARAAEAKGA